MQPVVILPHRAGEQPRFALFQVGGGEQRRAVRLQMRHKAAVGVDAHLVQQLLRAQICHHEKRYLTNALPADEIHLRLRDRPAVGPGLDDRNHLGTLRLKAPEPFLRKLPHTRQALITLVGRVNHTGHAAKELLIPKQGTGRVCIPRANRAKQLQLRIVLMNGMLRPCIQLCQNASGNIFHAYLPSPSISSIAVPSMNRMAAPLCARSPRTGHPATDSMVRSGGQTAFHGIITFPARRRFKGILFHIIHPYADRKRSETRPIWDRNCRVFPFPSLRKFRRGAILYPSQRRYTA